MSFPFPSYQPISGAESLLAGEAQGLALDFTDAAFLGTSGFYGSARVIDNGTPANNYDSHPYGLLTYTSPSVKMCRGPNGVFRYGANNLIQNSGFLNGASGTPGTAPSNFTWAASGGSSVFTGDGSATITVSAARQMTAQSLSSLFVVGATYTLGTTVNILSGTLAIRDIIWYDPSTITPINITATNNGIDSAYTTTLSAGVHNVTISFTVSSVTTGAIRIGIGCIANATGSVTISKPFVRRTPSDAAYLTTPVSATRYALPFEWDASGNPLGILCEEARTNLLLYSNDLTNAAWTKTNATAALTATGPAGVTNSATTITASGSNATVSQAITSANAARSGSVFLKRRTGTGTVSISLDNGSTYTAVDLSSGLWVQGNIENQTLTNPTFVIQLATSGDAVDVWCADLESGSFETSPIETFGAQVTRAADAITIANTSYPYGSARSYFLEWNQDVTSGGSNYYLSQNYVDANNYDAAYISAIDRTVSSFVKTSGSTVTTGGNGSAVSVANVHKLAVRVKLNDSNNALDGTAQTHTTSITPPTLSAGTLYIARGQSNANAINGHFRKFVCVPTDWADALLQGKTS